MTKVSENVKRANGVQRRKGSTIWHWGIKVPSDLKRLYRGQWAHRCSLETSDLRVANARAALLRAEWLDRFQRQRAGSSEVTAATVLLTPALVNEAAALMHARMLEADETRRLSGLTAQEMANQTLTLEIEAAQLGQSYASGNSWAVDKILPAWVQTLGLQVSDTDPLRPVLARELVKARLKATKAIQERQKGELVDTPSEPTLDALIALQASANGDYLDKLAAPQGTPRNLRDVFTRWKAGKVRSSDAVGACDRALALFETEFGSPPLMAITRAMGDSFRAHLLTQRLSSKTKHDRMTYVKSLLKYACRDLELIPKNPWEGLDIEYKTERRRTPWTADQLNAFFTQPLFTDYALPANTWRAGGAAAYWVPLLGLFTGARIGELCQLRVSDIQITESGPFLSINEDAEGRSVKTAASIRLVPIHPELVRLGLLEYASDLAKVGEVTLWPALQQRKGKPGGYFSDWFGSFRRSCSPQVPDFHSFRHTVRTAMTEAGISEAIQDRITGHEVRGSTGTRVYAHPKAVLRHAIEAITYPSLQLPAVYLNR